MNFSFQRFIFLLPFLFFSAIPSFGQWQAVNPPGFILYGDLMVAQGKFFVCNEFTYPEFLRSDDNGLTWKKLTLPKTSGYPTSIQSDGLNLYVFSVASSGNSFKFEIYSSSDAGQTWLEIPMPTGYNQFSPASNFRMTVLGNGNLFFYHDSRVFFREPSTGDWTLIYNTGNPDNILTIQQNGQTLWLSTELGLLKQTQPGGAWENVQPDWYAHSMACLNGNLVVATPSEILRSEDDGQTWSQIVIPSAAPSLTRFEISDGKIILVSHQLVLSSVDGFKTFTKIFDHDFITENMIDCAISNGFQVLTTISDIYRTTVGNSDWQWCGTGIGFENEQLIHLKSVGDHLFITDLNGFSSFTNNDGALWKSGFQNSAIQDVVKKGDNWFLKGQYGDSLYTSKNLIDGQALKANIGFLGTFKLFVDGGDLVAIIKITNTDIQVARSKDDGKTWAFEGASAVTPIGWNEAQYQDGNVFYLFDSDNHLLRKSLDFGITWTDLPTSFGSPLFVYSFSAKGNRIYTSDTESINYSLDAGLTWTKITPVFPGSLDFIIDQLFATSAGLFAYDIVHGLRFSFDDGQNFYPATAGLPDGNIEIYEFGEHGNSIFLTDVLGRIFKRDNSSLQFAEYSGKAYLDENNNAQPDPTEKPFKNLMIYAKTGGGTAVSSSDGTFKFWAEQFSDSLLAINSSKYAKINPPGYAVSQTDSLKNFGIYFTPGIKDLSISATNINVFRPGFETFVSLTAANVGTEKMDGSVVLRFPDWLEVLEISPAPTSQTADEIVWNFTNLNPFDHLNFLVKFKTPVGTPLGKQVEMSAKISPTAGDENQTNNFDRISTTVVGSFDPNDKAVAPKNYSPDSLAARVPLIYTIRFQNTGNYPASSVIVRDTLSENLDWKTLEVLAASHEFEWKISGRGIVEFNFEGINLPDSLANEPESHGFIKFSVNPKANLSLGDFVSNTAFIYFDYNDPVVTNTVKSTIEQISWVGDPENFHQISISPNPASDFATVSFPEILEKGSILKVFSGNGRLVQEVLADEKEVKFSVNQLPTGSCFLICKSGQQVFSGKMTVVRN